MVIWGMMASNCQPVEEDNFHLRFTKVNGLNEKDGVYIKDFQIGKVSTIRLDKDYSVIVGIKLDADLKLGKDSKFEIRSRTIQGEKEISVVIGSAPDYILRSDTMEGISEVILKTKYRNVRELLDGYSSELNTDEHDSLLLEIARLKAIVDSAEAKKDTTSTKGARSN